MNYQSRYYGEKIYIPLNVFYEIENHLLNSQEFDQAGNEETIKTFTAKFKNGKEADIKICNAPKDEGGPYIDSVLFDENGNEIALLDVGESLIEEFVFEYNADFYQVIFESY